MNRRLHKRFVRAARRLLADRLRGEATYGAGTLPQAFAVARRDVELNELWERLEDAGLVRLVFEPDEGWTWSDLEGDWFDVELHEDSVPGGARTIRAEQKRFRDLVERDGIWMVRSEYRLRPGDRWILADTIGMVIGAPMEWEEQGNAQDLKKAAVEQLKESLRDRCPQCRGVRR